MQAQASPRKARFRAFISSHGYLDWCTVIGMIFGACYGGYLGFVKAVNIWASIPLALIGVVAGLFIGGMAGRFAGFVIPIALFIWLLNILGAF